jgi:hypothetical protein
MITSHKEGPLFRDFSRKKLYKLRSGVNGYFNTFRKNEKTPFTNILGFKIVLKRDFEILHILLDSKNPRNRFSRNNH